MNLYAYAYYKRIFIFLYTTYNISAFPFHNLPLSTNTVLKRRFYNKCFTVQENILKYVRAKSDKELYEIH